MKYHLLSLLALGSIAATASASEHQLKAGTWQIREGIGIQQNSAGQSARDICVEDGFTQASTEWFVKLAQPSDDCTSKIVSQTANTIKVNFACPMSGRTLKGPSTITLTSNRISIDSDLALDLPYAPLPMRQSKIVDHVSDRCS